MASFPSQRQSQLTQRPNDQPLLRNIPLDITGACDDVAFERMALLLIMLLGSAVVASPRCLSFSTLNAIM